MRLKMADFEEPSPPEAEVLNDVSAPPRPQLRLHHFFALTAVAAVIFAIEGPMWERWSVGDDESSRGIAVVWMFWSMLYSLCLAAAVTAIAYAIFWQRQGVSFFDQPGHWLLLEIAVTGLLWVAVYGILWRVLQSEDGTYYSSWAAYELLWLSVLSLTVANFALNIYIAWKKCREWRWKSVFILKSFSFIAQFFQPLPLGAIAVTAATLIALNRDRRQHVVRDAAHWCGVGLELATCALAFGSAAVNWFYMNFIQ
jgi:hypothetical protein